MVLTLYKYLPCRIYNQQGKLITHGVATVSRFNGSIKSVLDHTATRHFSPLDYNIEVLTNG